ncbi:imidazole glycerol phosphate synthase subunit HisH [Telmatospirillum sp. J64-1]|uniref:imidazole glycerol phosphate synthase subunit HisH n=1 Tax=Telmatospirillum sp. J64-1 TaxID=2502183 RepID=UPI00115C86C4|nr:imidazole glycerol phosphate synthase subunit HisH [Telmatospirillum sp. J64-1]
MNVAIIDYGSGNLRSAAKAFERAVAEAGLDIAVAVTSDPEAVRRADRVVLPGVGAFGDCIKGLNALSGMREAMEEAVHGAGRPFLGICVGMQLMASKGREHGEHRGLGWIDGEVVPITPADPALKVPHMGWNELDFTPGRHPLLDGLEPGAHAYFVHSYHFVCADPAQSLASVSYGEALTAVIGRGNMVGTQFHPEKSQATGLAVLTNFLRWKP